MTWEPSRTSYSHSHLFCGVTQKPHVLVDSHHILCLSQVLIEIGRRGRLPTPLTKENDFTEYEQGGAFVVDIRWL